MQVNVNIFICVTDCMSEEDLRINWRKIRNESAETYQLDNIDDFERWNFYLFYVVNDKRELNRSLKYEIEHDTISSRKVIVSANEYKEKDIKNLISSYIKYDINIVKEVTKPVDFCLNEVAIKIVGYED